MVMKNRKYIHTSPFLWWEQLTLSETSMFYNKAGKPLLFCLETTSHCVSLAGLVLDVYTRPGLECTEIHLSLSPSAEIKDVHHQP